MWITAAISIYLWVSYSYPSCVLICGKKKTGIENTKKVILAHLSEENNDEDKVLTTLKEKFIEEQIDFDDFLIAQQKCKTEAIIIWYRLFVLVN